MARFISRGWWCGLSTICLMGCGPEAAELTTQGEGGSAGGQPVAQCPSDASSEVLAAGSETSGDFNPRLPAVLAHPSGAVVFAESYGDTVIARDSGLEAIEDGSHSYSPEQSPGGRWIVVRRQDDLVRVTDLENGYDVALEGYARADFFQHPADGEAVLLSADRLVTVTQSGVRDLGEGADRVEVSPAGSVAITEDPSGHRVVDLADGTARPLGRGDGVAEPSRDGRYVTFSAGRSAGEQRRTLEVIDTGSLQTVAELPYEGTEGGYYRAPIHSVAAGHSFAVARPGGGLTLFHGDAEPMQWPRGQPSAVLGEHHVIVFDGPTLEFVDLASLQATSLTGLSSAPGSSLGSEFVEVQSPQGWVYATVANVGATPCVIAADAHSSTLTTLACIESEQTAPEVLWAGDDGRVLVAVWDEATEQQRLELYQTDGTLEATLLPGTPVYRTLGSRPDRVWVASGGDVFEVDLLSLQLRTIATADVVEFSVPFSGCTAALALACTRPSDAPDSGPHVEWQVARHPLGADGPVIDAGCN